MPTQVRLLRQQRVVAALPRRHAHILAHRFGHRAPQERHVAQRNVAAALDAHIERRPHHGVHVHVATDNRAGRIRRPTPVHRYVHVAAEVLAGERREVQRPVAGQLAQAGHGGHRLAVAQHPGDERRGRAVRRTVQLGAAVVAERQPGGRLVQEGGRLVVMAAGRRAAGAAAVMAVNGAAAGGGVGGGDGAGAGALWCDWKGEQWMNDGLNVLEHIPYIHLCLIIINTYS